MTLLSQETELVQSAALGAVLQWRFACGYSPTTLRHRFVPMPLLFIVLPVVLNERIRDQIQRTKKTSGLRGFENKFLLGDAYKGDLLAIHERMLGMRDLSMRSFGLALACELLHFDVAAAAIRPTSYVRIKEIPDHVDRMCKAAEKLGMWCGDMTLFEVANILEVDL